MFNMVPDAIQWIFLGGGPHTKYCFWLWTSVIFFQDLAVHNVAITNLWLQPSGRACELQVSNSDTNPPSYGQNLKLLDDHV